FRPARGRADGVGGMKRCPSCRRVYDRDSEVCRADGATLADFTMGPVVIDPVGMDSVVGQTSAKRYRGVRKVAGDTRGPGCLAAGAWGPSTWERSSRPGTTLHSRFSSKSSSVTTRP